MNKTYLTSNEDLVNYVYSGGRITTGDGVKTYVMLDRIIYEESVEGNTIVTGLETMAIQPDPKKWWKVV
jgi:hypothetical protein